MVTCRRNGAQFPWSRDRPCQVGSPYVTGLAASPDHLDTAVSDQALADAIRIVQSVRVHRNATISILGNFIPFAVLAVMDWGAIVSSNAIYPLAIIGLLTLPIIRSYLRLRGRPVPESVSKRRIRIIAIHFILVGLSWSVATLLLLSEVSSRDAIVTFVVLGTMTYAIAGAFGALPIAAMGFAAPVYLALLIGFVANDILSLQLIVTLFIAQVAGLVLVIRWTWASTRRAVQLSLIVESQKQAMESVSDQLARYVSPQLYRKIFSGEQKSEIVAQRKKLTVFFSDVVNFTEITDQLESEELTSLLNHYLSEMSVIANDHGATFDKFIGDAIVLYFGDPDTNGVKEDAGAALRMAIAMQQRVRRLQGEWRERGVERPFEIRIGINTGYCTVGNFGNAERMDYTIIGSEVNLASRLESSADVGGILLSNETHSLVKDWVMTEQAESVMVKGFARPITTYRVVGIYDELAAEGRIIHHDEDGVRLTIDRSVLSDEERADAIRLLERTATELKQ